MAGRSREQINAMIDALEHELETAVDEPDDTATPSPAPVATTDPETAELETAIQEAEAAGDTALAYSLKIQHARKQHSTTADTADEADVADLQRRITDAEREKDWSTSGILKTQLAQLKAQGALTADGVPVADNTSDAEPTTEQLRAQLAEAEENGNRQDAARIKLTLARRYAGR